MTLVVLVNVGGGVYFRQRGFKKPYYKHQPEARLTQKRTKQLAAIAKGLD